MMIKAKRIELMSMLNRLPTLNNLTGFKLSYAVAKNRIALEDEQRILNDMMKPSVKFNEFHKKREELAKKCADKDENGKPIIEGGKYKGALENPEFTKAFETLKEDYKDVREAEDNKTKEYEEKMYDEIEFNMHMIGPEEIPNEVSVVQMEALYLMIRDQDGFIQKKSQKPKEVPVPGSKKKVVPLEPPEEGSENPAH